MGWSRDRARGDFALHVPSQSLAEVDRYIARPGQALAYKLGELEIETAAEGRAGARLTIRRPRLPRRRAAQWRAPLDLLEPQVDAYIAAVKGAG